MKHIISKEEFVALMVETQNQTKEEAEMLAKEYRNNIGAYVSDIGGDEYSLRSALVAIRKLAFKGKI